MLLDFHHLRGISNYAEQQRPKAVSVVLWADVSPMIGMLMLPKTCMYMWMVVMGLKEARAEESIGIIDKAI